MRPSPGETAGTKIPQSTRVGYEQKYGWINREIEKVGGQAHGTSDAVMMRGGNAFKEVVKPIMDKADRYFGADHAIRPGH